jgi:hypothetical protein
VTLYAYGLEALILFSTPGAEHGLRALRWRPAALQAVGTVAAAVGMNGGLWDLFHPLVPLTRAEVLARSRYAFSHLPHGFIAKLLGVGPGQLGDWLLYQGTMVAVIAVALVLVAREPVGRRVLALLAVPFAFGTVMYVISRVSPGLSGLGFFPSSSLATAGNSIAALPLLMFLLAGIAMTLRRRQQPGPDLPGPVVPPGTA